MPAAIRVIERLCRRTLDVMIFVVVLALMAMGDLVWWVWADRASRRLRHPRLWRGAIGIFTGLQFAYLVWAVLFNAQSRHAHHWMPAPVLACFYVWHVFVLPPTVLTIAFGSGIGRIVKRFRRKPATVNAEAPTIGSVFSRRHVLTAAALAAPPVLLGGAVSRAMAQLGEFRISQVDVPIADLPADLDGLTIAHVSDVHIGRFTRAGMLPKILDATNSLKADVVAFTGDLIDIAISDLPTGIDFMRKLDPRQGMFMIEGNHDLIESPGEFEDTVRLARLPLLIDQTTTIMLRGRTTPVQILGMSWSHSDVHIAGSMGELVRQRNPNAFQILLAHHPHAFDAAAAVGIPLTLSGHTHGGQLMLNERLGAGPAMFRYWTGTYRKGPRTLIVSNGVGNWFPLRFHAPAEIAKLTLRKV
jgi:predicted MPP superfamily phosphohydrolase